MSDYKVPGVFVEDLGDKRVMRTVCGRCKSELVYEKKKKTDEAWGELEYLEVQPCTNCDDKKVLEQRLSGINFLVQKQAKDEGLWFVAKTAPEAYLQQELRRLHKRIEDDKALYEEEWDD